MYTFEIGTSIDSISQCFKVNLAPQNWKWKTIIIASWILVLYACHFIKGLQNRQTQYSIKAINLVICIYVICRKFWFDEWISGIKVWPFVNLRNYFRYVSPDWMHWAIKVIIRKIRAVGNIMGNWLISWIQFPLIGLNVI